VATVFRPTRTKGQCFLKDPQFIQRIVDTLSPAAGETLLEIGAGEGQLTVPILDSGARVIAVETDRRLAEKLRRIATPGLDLVEADALELDFNQLLDERGLERIRGYGNLPYSVAAPILLRLLSSATRFSSLTLMFQKEVAERLIALPSTKDYSFLTVITQQAARTRLLFRIPGDAFRPRPRVVSALVQLELRHDEAPDVGDIMVFRALVKGLLAHRRKTIANNIKRLTATPSSERVAAAVDAVGIDPTRRAETLSVEEFAAISRICAVPG
jgi:16S rRNA (adenine1518-N6/adenine1519-N6)-dimethyltransferase